MKNLCGKVLGTTKMSKVLAIDFNSLPVPESLARFCLFQNKEPNTKKDAEIAIYYLSASSPLR